MSQIALNFNFPSDLLLYSTLLQLGLVKDFECTDKARRTFLCEIYPSKFSFAERLSDFEHPKVQFLRSWLLVNGSRGALVIFVGVARSSGGNRYLLALTWRGSLARIELCFICVLKGQFQEIRAVCIRG